jgi:hypothetical protein
VTAVAAALVSAGRGGTEARVSGSGKKIRL